ncbi:MAG: CRISPR-associated endonuclease Cas2 [Candidatus Nanoarchaeia archaeon]|nr:CRISPR-associated endonuclease Cas2 [Candidatus Nanoarchaeia archaeon]
MLYWVIYDISSTKVRNKVVSACKNYGLIRAQKSAFIGDLTRNKKEMLSLEIGKLQTSNTDCIFMIPSCKCCFSDKEIIGTLDEERLKERDFVIIQGKNE